MEIAVNAKDGSITRLDITDEQSKLFRVVSRG